MRIILRGILYSKFYGSWFSGRSFRNFNYDICLPLLSGALPFDKLDMKLNVEDGVGH